MSKILTSHRILYSKISKLPIQLHEVYFVSFQMKWLPFIARYINRNRIESSIIEASEAKMTEMSQMAQRKRIRKPKLESC